MADGATTAGAAQQQEFDPVALARQRYPGLTNQSDARIIGHLANPANFRSAFPEYAHLDDDTIARNMAPHAQRNAPSMTPRAVQLGIKAGQSFEPTPFEEERNPQNQPGFWATVGNWLKRAVAAPPPSAAESVLQSLGPGGPAAVATASAVAGYQGARERGHGVPYSINAGAAAPLGVDAERMEQAAAVGNWKGILGEAAVPTAMALTPLADEAARPLARPLSRAVTRVGETAPVKVIAGLPKRVAEPYGIGVSGESLLKKGIAPYAKQTGYDAAVARAGDDIVAYHKENPIKTVKDLDEGLPKMQDKVMAEEVHPAASRHAAEELPPERLGRVKQAVEDSLSPFAKKVGREVPKEVQGFLDELDKAHTVQDLIGIEKGDRGGALGDVNAKLESYFNKYPSARRGDLMKNPETAAWEAARRALREEAMGYLEEKGEGGIREARQRWGALEELRRATERRVNQAERGKPFSLSRILGLTLAPVTGGTSALLTEIAHYLNQPDVLVQRGIKRMTRQSAKPISVTPKSGGPPMVGFQRGKGAAAARMIEEPPKTTPEQVAQSRASEIERLQKILEDPRATSEDKAIAESQVRTHRELFEREARRAKPLRRPSPAA